MGIAERLLEGHRNWSALTLTMIASVTADGGSQDAPTRVPKGICLLAGRSVKIVGLKLVAALNR
jgi:hypothetical protein